MKFDFTNIDRRWIYLCLFLALSLPLIQRVSLRPARLPAADRFFEIVDHLEVKRGEVAFVALDFGPNSMAENAPQADLVIEHLMRRRIPILLFSQYALAESFLVDVPERIAAKLSKEDPSQHWEYGTDWVNLGYRPGSYLVIQAITKAPSLVEYFKNDSRGNSLADLPIFKDVRDFSSIKLLVQLTSLVGTFESFVQFFQTENHHPIVLHGCTSITIPKAFIYLDSGQMQGLLEGLAGAAWYSDRLSRAFAGRETDKDLLVTNTGLGLAQLVIVAFIVLGNLAAFISRAQGDRP